jgi:glycosyltransferase involved in cell wall biosynthesis
MKVFYDYQIFAAQRNGGISRLFSNLINHVAQLPNTEVFLPIVEHENEYLQKNPRIINPQISVKKSLFNFWQKNQNQKFSEEFLQAQKFDVLHATYYDDYFLPHLKNKPFVTTIHDMTYEIFPEFFSPKDRTSNQKIASAYKANKIITVSHNTKKDLLNLTDIKEEKIVVVPIACSLDPEISTNPFPQNNVGKYLLYVGTRGIYKNFYFMLRSIKKILHDHSDLTLLCFGAPFNKKELIFLENLGLQNKIKAVSGGDDILVWLYKNAQAFIGPSYCEGFYMTLLEAFACGCPVLACNREPIPEVAGDAAIYFDAKDNIAIEKSVERILSDKALRDDLIKKGFARNKLFSWQEIAKQTRQVYESL